MMYFNVIHTYWVEENKPTTVDFIINFLVTSTEKFEQRTGSNIKLHIEETERVKAKLWDLWADTDLRDSD